MSLFTAIEILCILDILSIIFLFCGAHELFQMNEKLSTIAGYYFIFLGIIGILGLIVIIIAVLNGSMGAL